MVININNCLDQHLSFFLYHFEGDNARYHGCIEYIWVQWWRAEAYWVNVVIALGWREWQIDILEYS